MPLSTIMRRLLAALLCLCLSPAFAQEEEAAPITLLSHSHTSRTASGVRVSGTRAGVDFEYLKTLNPDCVGWLYQESSALSYPVMQSIDNEWYLTYGFDNGKLNDKGMAVLDVACNADFSDDVLYLFGSGREGSCFETLNNYTDPLYAIANPSLRLLTPGGDYHADIFACLVTKQNDNSSWRVPETDFQPWLDGVVAASTFVSGKAVRPKEGDKLLVIVVNNKNARRRVLLCRLCPIEYSTSTSCDLVKQPLDLKESQNGMVQVGPLGQFMNYAQNDPIFDRMRYESELNPTFRVFGGGGCGPTAAAIAIANVVDKEDLPKLRQHSKNGMGTLFCACSVNRVYCSHMHPAYLLETPDEYLRYLPVAMADFATGNNEWSDVARRAGATGTSMKFLNLVCDIYGLERTTVKNLTEGLEKMKVLTGKAVMVCTALRKSPFTNSSHFVVVAGTDDEYFYVLDPWRRDDYKKTDTRGILELLTPGVTRIKLEHSGLSDLSPVYIIENPAR